MEGGKGNIEENVRGLRSINGRYKIGGRGGVKNSIRNGEAKELICMTHGHELKGGVAVGKGGTWRTEAKGEKLGQLQ